MEWKRGLDLFLHGRSALSYVWTMRAARFEYDIQSAVKRKVRYLPHAAGPGGSNVSPMGGFLLAVPANLPEARARRAFEAIASMASPEAMRVHAKNGFPVVPRFSVAADPEVLAGSPLISVVDGLAKRSLISTRQRPEVPQYTAIESILGEVLHRALRRECSDAAALAEAQGAVERLMAIMRAPRPRRGFRRPIAAVRHQEMARSRRSRRRIPGRPPPGRSRRGSSGGRPGCRRARSA